MAEITRNHLYEQVWSRPMTKVAADYGVTSTALKKTCDRHEIPTPERGYWAKLQHGKKVKFQPLPVASSPYLEEVRIVGSAGSRLPTVVQEAKTEALQRLAEHSIPPVAAQDTIDSREEPAILLPTRRAALKARPTAEGFISVSGKGIVALTISPGTVERCLRVLSDLLEFAETQGYSSQTAEGGLVLVVDGERVDFAIEEQRAKSPHVPAPSELRLQEEHRKWGLSDTPWPKYDHSPSGRLGFVVKENSHSGLRRTFADGRTQSLETMLPEILASVAAHAALIKERRREADEFRRRHEIAETRRRLQEAFSSREKQRMTFVEAVHEQLREREKLSAVLGYFNEVDPDEQDLPSSMVTWLKRRIAQIDATIGPRALGLSARVDKVDFDEPDERTRDNHWYYSSFRELHLWSEHPEDDTFKTQTPFEWATNAGLLDPPPKSGTEGDESE